MSDFELLREFFRFFGGKRAATLFGWCAYWDIVGEKRSPKELREIIEREGATERSAYRVLVDFRRFRDHIEQLEGKRLSEWEISSRLAGVT